VKDAAPHPERSEAYNATITGIRRIHSDLALFQVLPDFGQLDFSAGQYTVLGLGDWEPFEASRCEAAGESTHKLIERPYSISCPLLDDKGLLQTATRTPILEFYVTLVGSKDAAAALTPRLFLRKPGDRIYCGPRAHGHYGLTGIDPDDDIVFAATGTGEAPHNAMLAELLSRQHRGRIVCVACVRYCRDLGYLETHRRLESSYSNYRYLTLTTREAENTDSALPGFVGKRYLQDYFASGDFERDADLNLVPGRLHVFLCGAPDMIGIPRRTHDPGQRYPKPRGMIEVLEQRGFRIDLPHAPGDVHFEKYW
jgi:ferredoxin--NADP+ reductase